MPGCHSSANGRAVAAAGARAVLAASAQAASSTRLSSTMHWAAIASSRPIGPTPSPVLACSPT